MSLHFLIGWTVKCPKCRDIENYSLASILECRDVAKPFLADCLKCGFEFPFEWTANDMSGIDKLRQEIEKIEREGRHLIQQGLAKCRFRVVTRPPE